MPYSKSDLKALPDSTKNLTKKQKEKFVDVFNSLVDQGKSEDASTKIAITQAKKVRTRKSNIIPDIQEFDEEQMIAIEMIYEPNVPDAHGQYMSEDTVRKACESFNKNLLTGNVKPNLFHIAETDKFTILKTWINEVECTIGDYLIPEGAWLGSTQFHDEDLWKAKKQGEIGGVSIGGIGIVHPPKKEGL